MVERENIDNEKATAALVMLAEAIGIEPECMAVAGRNVPEGFELRVLIVPESEPESEPDPVLSEQEQELGRMVDELFS